MGKVYEKPIVKCTDIKDLSERMQKNLAEAQALYNEVKVINKSGCLLENLFNMQFVMDWQDGLNEVSITKKEDA